MVVEVLEHLADIHFRFDIGVVGDIRQQGFAVDCIGGIEGFLVGKVDHRDADEAGLVPFEGLQATVGLDIDKTVLTQ